MAPSMFQNARSRQRTTRSISRDQRADTSRAPRPGNQTHLRRLSATTTSLQAKLAIGAVDDPLEHEADAAADRVMRMADPATLQRKCDACDDEEKGALHREAGGAAPVSAGEAPTIVHDVLQTPGHPLDPATHAFMSDRFGADFGEVRVHTDARAAESAAAVNAHAYTVGRDVVFGAGRYDPAGETGRRLIAHELTHTLQQGAAPALVQRDGPAVPLKEAKKEDAVDALGGGVKDMGKKFADDPKMKAFALGLAKKYAEPVWSGASDPDKAAIVIGGAAIVGTGVAALASDPNGRGLLADLPLGKALDLVPYAIFSDFKPDLPKTKTDPFLVHFSLKADDYLDLLRAKYSFLPKMTLSFDTTLAVAPGGKVTMPFGLAKFSPLPGVVIGGGFGVTTDLPNLISPPAGGPLAPYKALPTPAQPAPRGGEAAFVTVDLTKLEATRAIFAPLVGDFADKK